VRAKKAEAPVLTELEDVEEEIDYGFVSRVKKIEWERVLLTIRVELNPTGDVPVPAVDGVGLGFELVDGRRSHPVSATNLGGGAFELHMNITVFDGRDAIPNGTWRIRSLVDGEQGPVAEYDGSALEALDDASRVFLYEKNRAVMTVSFGIAEAVDHLDFLMRTYHLQRKPRVKRKGPIKWFKTTFLSGKAKTRYARIYFAAIRKTIGPRTGRVLFASDQRLTIQGNLRRVQERLLQRGLADRFDFKYSFRLPKTTGWLTTLRILYLMATSEFILLDDYFGLLKSVKFDRRQKVIQLWHAGSGFKSVGYSRFGNLGSPRLWHPHRQYTYAITGSKHLVPVYAEAFGVEESAIIPTGLPRVDWFLDDEMTARFKVEFFTNHPELRHKRIILFAPTFRGRSIYKAFYDYDWIDFGALYDAIGPDTAVLFRMHHFVKSEVPIPDEYRDRFFDFTRFSDGLSLLHVTDLLITDYSSIIYEYSLLDRPMLFFAPDKVNYAATRGFHRDYDETAPGRVAATFEEVIDAITTGEFEQEKVAKFRAENFDRIDTGAADRVIDWLLLGELHTSRDAGERHDLSVARIGGLTSLPDNAERTTAPDAEIDDEGEDRA